MDVEYYHPKFKMLIDKLYQSKGKVKLMKDIAVSVVDGPFGSAIKAEDYAESGIPLLRVANITHGNGSISEKDMVYIYEETHQKILRSKVVPGYVVIAKTGATMGAAGVIPDNIIEANIRADLAAINLNNDRVLAKYLVSYINTDIGQTLFWRLNSGATRGRVVIENLRKYPILLPDKDTMITVNKIMDKAYLRKKELENEVDYLNEYIQEYVLSQLELTMEPIEKNIVYIGCRSYIAGERIDCDYYNPMYKNISGKLKSKYPIQILEHLVEDIFNGNTPSKDKYSELTTMPKIIKVACLNDGEVDFSMGDYISNEFTPTKFIQVGDVLLLAAAHQVEYLGKNPCIVNIPKQLEGEKITFVGELLNIRTNKEELNSDYLCSLLSLPYYYKLINREKRGQTSHLYPYDMKRIPIVKPPLDIQIRIAEEVIRTKEIVRQKKLQAESIVKEAKAKVEKIIVGDNSI